LGSIRQSLALLFRIDPEIDAIALPSITIRQDHPGQGGIEIGSKNESLLNHSPSSRWQAKVIGGAPQLS
jgi:hypothetical protein